MKGYGAVLIENGLCLFVLLFCCFAQKYHIHEWNFRKVGHGHAMMCGARCQRFFVTEKLDLIVLAFMKLPIDISPSRKDGTTQVAGAYCCHIRTEIYDALRF